MQGKKLKGAGSMAWAAIAIVIVIAVSLVTVSYITLTTLRPPIAVVEFDGEFDDWFLAAKGFFYSDFTEGTDCNITSDVLGGSSFTACIYETTTTIDGSTSGILNGTDFVYAGVFDLDGPVKKIAIDANLKNTGTLQARDDIVIKEFSLWTYEDKPKLLIDFTDKIDDAKELDVSFTTIPGFNHIPGDEYVIAITFHSKLILPAGADGDDLMLIEIDADTSGDTDSIRVTLESG